MITNDGKIAEKKGDAVAEYNLVTLDEIALLWYSYLVDRHYGGGIPFWHFSSGNANCFHRR